MGLKKSSVWMRAKIALEAFLKYERENKSKRFIDRYARRSKHYTHLLEKYNKETDAPVICE